MKADVKSVLKTLRDPAWFGGAKRTVDKTTPNDAPAALKDYFAHTVLASMAGSPVRDLVLQSIKDVDWGEVRMHLFFNTAQQWAMDFEKQLLEVLPADAKFMANTVLTALKSQVAQTQSGREVEHLELVLGNLYDITSAALRHYTKWLEGRGVTTTTYTQEHSSLIAALRYDRPAKQLTVRFHNGRVYQYQNVAWETVVQFRTADSLGRFYNQHIKQRNYQERPVQWTTPEWIAAATR